ncbi:MAG: YbaB/EbfC family nucleoid-associated protein, partial [Holosporaceae bacterium]|nr:YbaB/EbfC family nucleoid-associated protein [Holosporaceae bacterium]
MKQAQQMQAKLMEAQNKMNEMEITGTSGGGMVTIVINGKG